MISSRIKSKEAAALRTKFFSLKVGDKIKRVPRASNRTFNTTFGRSYQIFGIEHEPKRSLIIINDQMRISRIRINDFINRYDFEEENQSLEAVLDIEKMDGEIILSAL